MNHLFIDIKGHVCPFSICSWRSLEVYDVSCVDLEETVNFWFLSTCFLWKLATKLVSFSHSDFLWGLFKGLFFCSCGPMCSVLIFKTLYISSFFAFKTFNSTLKMTVVSFYLYMKTSQLCLQSPRHLHIHVSQWWSSFCCFISFPSNQTLPSSNASPFLFVLSANWERWAVFVFFLFVHAFYIQDGSNYTFFFFLLLAFLCV